MSTKPPSPPKFPNTPPKVIAGDHISYWVGRPVYEIRTGFVERPDSFCSAPEGSFESHKYWHDTDDYLVLCTSCKHHRVDTVPRCYIIEKGTPIPPEHLQNMQTNSPIPANTSNTPETFTHAEIKAALHSWFIHEQKRNPSFAPKDEHTDTLCDTPDLYADLIFRNLEALIRQNNLKQSNTQTNEQ